MFHSLLSLAAVALVALAHGPEPDDVSLYRRNNLLERDSIQKRCGATLYGIHKRRLERRGELGPARRDAPTSAALCSMTPELTEGPYHVNNEIYRQNVTDGQAGVPLTLHVTFLDVSTCEVAPNLWMEIWAANATGFYSGFVIASSNAGGGGGGPPGGGNGTGGPPGGGFPGAGGPSGTASPSRTGTTSGAASTTTSLSPLSGADSGGRGGGGQNATDNLTFLRGVTQADDKGEATMYTLVPGWYTGRAVHIHIRVFNGSSVADNGTFISSSGVAHHTGQVFFKQDLLDDIAKLEPYSLNKLAYVNSTTNEQDGIYPYSSIGGYDPDLETSLVGDDIAGGLEGHIVITINGSYVSPEVASAYYNPSADNTTSSNSTTNGTSDAPSSAARRFSLMGLY